MAAVPRCSTVSSCAGSSTPRLTCTPVIPWTARSAAPASVTEPSTYSKRSPSSALARAGLRTSSRTWWPSASSRLATGAPISPVAPTTRMRAISVQAFGRRAESLRHVAADHFGDQLHRGERAEENRQFAGQAIGLVIDYVQPMCPLPAQRGFEQDDTGVPFHDLADQFEGRQFLGQHAEQEGCGLLPP